MGEGLREFGNGLSAAIERQAEKRGRTLEAQLAHERDETALLSRLLEERIARAADEPERKAAAAMRGLIDIARYATDDFTGSAPDLSGPVGAGIERFIALLKSYEDALEAGTALSAVERGMRAWQEAIQR